MSNGFHRCEHLLQLRWSCQRKMLCLVLGLGLPFVAGCGSTISARQKISAFASKEQRSSSGRATLGTATMSDPAASGLECAAESSGISLVSGKQDRLPTPIQLGKPDFTDATVRLSGETSLGVLIEGDSHQRAVYPSVESVADGRTDERNLSGPSSLGKHSGPAHQHRFPAEPASSFDRVLDSTQDSLAFRDLTEDEMLATALADSPLLRPLGVRILSSPDAASTVYDTAIQQTDPFFGPNAALAEFDSQISAGLTANKNDRVFNNETLGGDVQELVQDTIDARVGWQKRAWNGAVFDIQSIQQYDDNNRSGNRFPNYWESLLEVGVRQPLLRGAGRQFNQIAGPNARPGFNFSNGIILARLTTRVTEAEFEIALRDFTSNLYSAYWDLYREYQSLKAFQEARDLAYQVWQMTLARKQAGITGGEANVEAQARARYFRLVRDVALARDGNRDNAGYYVAERALRQLMGLPVDDGQTLRPSDPPADVRYAYDFGHLKAKAIVSRTELRRQQLRVAQQQYRLIASQNFLLPQLDLVGRYRLRGFGDDLYGSGPQFASASGDFFSFDHQEWQFGIEAGVPVNRRQAKSAVVNARLQLTRERRVLEEQQRTLLFEVANAMAEVTSAFEALDNSRQIMVATKARLDSSVALFEADKLQIDFLLDAQEDHVRAQQQIAEDQARYSIALIKVNATTGTLLGDLGIHVSESCCQTAIVH